MALTPQSSQAFMSEVDDELRRERLTSFWTRWGLVIGAVLLIGLACYALAALAGTTMRRSSR